MYGAGVEPIAINVMPMVQGDQRLGSSPQAKGAALWLEVTQVRSHLPKLPPIATGMIAAYLGIHFPTERLLLDCLVSYRSLAGRVASTELRCRVVAGHVVMMLGAGGGPK